MPIIFCRGIECERVQDQFEDTHMGRTDNSISDEI